MKWTEGEDSSTCFKMVTWDNNLRAKRIKGNKRPGTLSARISSKYHFPIWEDFLWHLTGSRTNICARFLFLLILLACCHQSKNTLRRIERGGKPVNCSSKHPAAQLSLLAVSGWLVREPLRCPTSFHSLQVISFLSFTSSIGFLVAIDGTKKTTKVPKKWKTKDISFNIKSFLTTPTPSPGLFADFPTKSHKLLFKNYEHTAVAPERTNLSEVLPTTPFQKSLFIFQQSLSILVVL